MSSKAIQLHLDIYVIDMVHEFKEELKNVPKPRTTLVQQGLTLEMDNAIEGCGIIELQPRFGQCLIKGLNS
jgi:hypothetical protein